MTCHDDFGQRLKAEFLHSLHFFASVPPAEQLVTTGYQFLQLCLRFPDLLGHLSDGWRVRTIVEQILNFV